MRKCLGLAALVCAGLISLTAEAGTRSCTQAERNQADAALRTIKSDASRQKMLIELHAPFGLPKPISPESSGETVLVQGGYVMAHDSDLRTSVWVAYRLTAADVAAAEGNDRVNCFRKDPRLAPKDAAYPADYLEPIYDQGHLASDADLKDDLIQQVNSYVMSNMSPQHCRFNRGIWLSLEGLTRQWAKAYDEIYVINGAIFDRDGVPGRDADSKAERMKSNNGKNRVAVPSHYYRVYVRRTQGTVAAIGFLLEHNNNANGVQWNLVRPRAEQTITPIRDIEAEAGVTLFPKLERTSVLEDASLWDMTSANSNLEAGCR